MENISRVLGDACGYAPMNTVFVLQHEHEWCGRDEVKLIGVYLTRMDAEAAVQRIRLQPGFCDWPHGFCIGEYELGADHWTEGFSKMVTVFVGTNNPDIPYVGASCAWYPGDVYEICSMDTHDATTIPDYSIGQTVRCSERLIDGSTELVAEALIEKRA